MDVIHVPAQILIVPRGVLPIPALPDATFALGDAAGGAALSDGEAA